MNTHAYSFPFRLIVFVGALGLATAVLPAQEANQIEQLRRQVAQMQEDLVRTTREQQARIDALTSQLNTLAGSPPATQPAAPSQPAAPPAPATAVAATPADIGGAPRAGSAYMNMSFDALLTAGGSTAADPARFLELGDHDPAKRGLAMRNAEISLDGAVDPYLKGFSNIVLKLAPDNSTEIELEEAYVQTTAMPADLQVKAGQFFANFGRQNAQHPHTWGFVDQPLVLTRAFGPDGLRGLGVQATWLAPTPFYSEASLGVYDGEGGTAFSFRNPGEDDGTGTNRVHGRAAAVSPLRGVRDLLYVPRLSASLDPGDTQTVVFGVSGAFGPNSTGTDRRTAIYGADLYWKWKAPNASGGFPFLSWQTEGIITRLQAGADPLAPTPLPDETLRDNGVYSQLLWGFAPRWVAGLRFDHVDGNRGADDANDVFRNRRTRVSPGLTFFPSEFSKLRLQYNYDRGPAFGSASSVWTQMEFMLGAHGAHKF